MHSDPRGAARRELELDPQNPIARARLSAAAARTGVVWFSPLCSRVHNFSRTAPEVREALRKCHWYGPCCERAVHRILAGEGLSSGDTMRMPGHTLTREHITQLMRARPLAWYALAERYSAGQVPAEAIAQLLSSYNAPTATGGDYGEE